MKEVVIFTDGGCHRNPGPGGYGAILRYGEHAKELSGGYRLTTNNRMELRAAIAALAALKVPCRVTLHSDSRYVVDSMQKGWARRWRANDWRQRGSKRAANPDLWAELLDLCAIHEVRFVWVKGHAGIADNERCDALAEAACRQAGLPPDEPYEAQQLPKTHLFQATELPPETAASPSQHADESEDTESMPGHIRSD